MDFKKYLSGKAMYYVDDLILKDDKDIKYIFFLESPHVDEIKEENNLPLSGDSGKAVTKFLFGENETLPFSEKIKDDQYNQIAIINISNVPLQNIVFPDLTELTTQLNKIRKGASTNDELYNIFKEKMDKHNFSNVKKYIVCGEFASTYIEKYFKEKNWDLTKILKVPHPARGQWSFIQKNKNALEELQTLFSPFNK